jgi:hypothetical protein
VPACLCTSLYVAKGRGDCQSALSFMSSVESGSKLEAVIAAECRFVASLENRRRAAARLALALTGDRRLDEANSNDGILRYI